MNEWISFFFFKLLLIFRRTDFSILFNMNRCCMCVCVCALLISDHHQQIENIRRQSTNIFFSSQQCLILHSVFFSLFILWMSHKPQGILIIHIGIVDQKNFKKLKTTENKNIDKSICLYRRGKCLMQFKYCRQLRYKTNDKYYLINVYV
jgi:hypothetical protein